MIYSNMLHYKNIFISLILMINIHFNKGVKCKLKVCCVLDNIYSVQDHGPSDNSSAFVLSTLCNLIY